MSLQGWVIIYVRHDRDYPTMTSNVADGELAEWMAKLILDEGKGTEILAVCPAEALRQLPTVCHVPPRGWRCTRGAGHDGPCAAVPLPGESAKPA